MLRGTDQHRAIAKEAGSLARRMLRSAIALLHRQHAPRLHDPFDTTVLPELHGEAASETPPPREPSAPHAFSRIAEQALPAVVWVAGPTAAGSGFLVDPAGVLLTAYHVIATRRILPGRVTVQFTDGRQATARVILGHAVLDYALLWLEPPGPYPFLPISTAPLRHAEPVMAIGHPAHGGHDLRHTVSMGVVSNPAARHHGNIDYIQTDAAIDPGNSGGPLLDASGQAVALVSWAIPALAAGRFALPLSYVVDDLDVVRSRGRDVALARVLCRACGRAFFGEAPSACPNCGARKYFDGAPASATAPAPGEDERWTTSAVAAVAAGVERAASCQRTPLPDSSRAPTSNRSSTSSSKRRD